MRLTVRLVLWFFCFVVAALGASGVHAVRGELEHYEAALAERHVVMGLVLRSAFSEVMDTDGEARAVSVLDYTDKRMRLVDVRWVHLDESAPAERKPQTALHVLAPIQRDQIVHDKSETKLRSYIPVHIAGRSVSALEFSESLAGEKEVVRNAVTRALRSLVAIAFAIGLAAGVLGLVLVARPMRALVEHARRIGRGDLSPMDAPGTDEIAELGSEMNAMCVRLAEAQSAKLRTQEDLRHAERLGTVGKLASGLAHELGTPLNVITLRATSIARGRSTGEKAQAAAASIAEQAVRMTNLVRQLLDFARRKPPQRALVEVGSVVRRTVDLVEAVATKANTRLVVRTSETPHHTRGDGAQLEQVFTNLFVNAIQAVPARGDVEVTVSIEVATPPPAHGGATQEYVRVRVKDRGPGIAPEVLPHVFEPFFTTKDVGEGTGLGLAVCYGIVRDHGGWIDVHSDPSGAALTVNLPLVNG